MNTLTTIISPQAFNSEISDGRLVNCTRRAAQRWENVFNDQNGGFGPRLLHWVASAFS